MSRAVALVALLVLVAARAAGQEAGEGEGEEELCAVCACSEDAAVVDCADRRLSQLPKDISSGVKLLNLSNNEFTTFPNLQSLYTLETVDLSANQLTVLPADALTNLSSLATLDLSNNAFTRWRDINPNTLLLPAEKLLQLDLSDNVFENSTDLTDDAYIVSSSLETLILERSGITSITDKFPLSGLTNIKTLKLRENLLHKWEKMSSPTLETLDVSHCKLNYIHHSELAYLPALRVLDLSFNYRLLITTSVGNMSSDSLRELDVSYSNVDRVVLSGFPNLRRANLTGNMIRSINTNDFYNNTKLEVLDLSYNSISSLQSNCFRGLITLKQLNLTANLVSEVPEDTFMRTVTLISLTLSRNYFTKVGHIQSGTLQNLDMSMCEIDSIDKDSLEGLWSLKSLNLSRNLLSSLPETLSSDTLTTLDVSSNRLSAVSNNTFSMLPRLMTLLVSGNRFSSIWKRSYFTANRYLERIDLGDNTWRCECADADMFELYEFLTLEPSKMEEAGHLVCHSPANVTDMTWQDACDAIWFPAPTQATGNDLMVLCFTVVAFSLACCALVVTIVRRMLHSRMELVRQERERQAEEARERLRRLRMQHEQQAQCNAPDPRDLVSPPSYAEALLMPRPASMHSLNDAEKPKRKRGGRRRAKSSGDLVEEGRTVRLEEEEEEEEVGEEGRRARRERRRRQRYGSHELKELERSPRAPRRRLSAGELELGDTDAELERLVGGAPAAPVGNGVLSVDVRESDF